MKHRRFTLTACLVLLIAPFARADIESEVAAVLQDKLLHRASLGIQVMSLGNGPADLKEIFNHNAHQPHVPASNLKLVTTASCLEKLGADFKFRTQLLIRGQDLILIGDGDPTFGDSEYYKKFNWRSTTIFEQWAQQLKKMGITTVHDVIVDDSVFDEVFTHPDWPAKQMDAKYQAQVAGMNLNANLVDVLVSATQPGARAELSLDPPTSYFEIQNGVVTGTQNAVSVSRQLGSNRLVLKGQTPSRSGSKAWATVHDPSLFSATVLSEVVSSAGIKVTGQAKRDRTLRSHRPAEKSAGTWPVVGVHETPIAAVISRANKDSVNLYAESLCKRSGYDPAVGPGTWQNGTAATSAFLKSAGIPESDFQMADGSGLSKKNTISPRALVRVLCYEYYGKNREVYVNSLSVAGVDGTLEDRFKGSDLRQRVVGKSGFVEGVSTLSGLLKAKNGQMYAFSVMVNGIPQYSNGDVKLLQERIIKAVDQQVSAAK